MRSDGSKDGKVGMCWGNKLRTPQEEALGCCQDLGPLSMLSYCSIQPLLTEGSSKKVRAGRCGHIEGIIFSAGVEAEGRKVQRGNIHTSCINSSGFFLHLFLMRKSVREPLVVSPPQSPCQAAVTVLPQSTNQQPVQNGRTRG